MAVDPRLDDKVGTGKTGHLINGGPLKACDLLNVLEK